jgi:hypothetical protein
VQEVAEGHLAEQPVAVPAQQAQPVDLRGRGGCMGRGKGDMEGVTEGHLAEEQLVVPAQQAQT